MQEEVRGPGARPDPTIGTPETDVGAWDGKQSYDDTCAIRSQEFILEQFTGQEIAEDALVRQAQESGWYRPGQGTMPEDVGNVLEANGVPVNRYEDASTHDLANELAQGHKVIISVDSGELWGEQNPVVEQVSSVAPVDGADHAVVVSGIDTSDPNNLRVVVSDPGTGEAAATYPMDQFVAAWQDSSFFMTATQEPAPSTLPEMQNFDYEAGHIPEVAGMPYDEFAGLENHLQQWMEMLELAIRDQDSFSPDAFSDVERNAALVNLQVPDMPDPFDPDPSGPAMEPDAFRPTLEPSISDPFDPAAYEAPGTGPYPDFEPLRPGATQDPAFPVDPNDAVVGPSEVDPFDLDGPFGGFDTSEPDV